MGFIVKINNRIVNSVDPDETARYQPSHLDLHCLHMYMYWSSEMSVNVNCSLYFLDNVQDTNVS